MASIIDIYILMAGCLGTFPSVSPNPYSPKFKISWTHPKAWLSIFLCIVHLYVVVEYIYFIPKISVDSNDNVDRFLFYLFIFVIGTSDLVIRLTAMGKGTSIIELIKSLAGLSFKSPMRDPKRLTFEEILYLFAATQLIVYSIFRAYYFEIKLNNINSFLFFFVDTPAAQTTMQVIFFIVDLLHSFCIHFAFSFLYLVGVELCHNFHILCDLIVSTGQEYDDIDVIDGLKNEFIILRDCFNIYMEVAGNFFLALFFEVFPDTFRALVYLIFMNEPNQVRHDTFWMEVLGMLTGGLLLFLVINVGFWIWWARAVGQDKMLTLVYGGPTGNYAQEEVVQLGKMILHWDWAFFAAGVFVVDRGLIPMIFGLLISYVLLVFQFKISTECTGPSTAPNISNTTQLLTSIMTSTTMSTLSP